MAKHDKRVKYATGAEKPVMVSVRLPRELYDRLERYATQYRQSISELLKDGAEMRLEVDADPRSRSAGSTTEETEFQIDGASILREVRATLARHEAQMDARMQAIERQTAPGSNGPHEDVSYDVIHGMTAIEPEGQERPAARRPALAEAPAPAIQEAEPKQRASQPRLRPGILAVLREHPDGLTAVELKGYLGTTRHIGDTLSGMLRNELIVRNGTGQGIRYQLADAARAL